jgi:predicted ATPase/DNA-binding winged helix-turn-helix (wHTH) protein
MEGETYRFGSFELVPDERLLLDDGKPVELGSRALDTLILLVSSSGETVRNAQIMAHVWPTTTVDESSVRVHIAALRRALRDGHGDNRFIVTFPGRGYTFVAPVMRIGARPPAAAPGGAVPARILPTSLTSIIGRADTIVRLTAQLSSCRLLTIVGAGGIGKTTVAAAIAEAITTAYADGVWFVSLASLPASELVSTAVATALGVAAVSRDPLPALTAWLRDKRTLIVLDNCEHVIDSAALVAETILKAAPQVSILATSREPLHAEGEWQHRLGPLPVPPMRDGINAAEALTYGAVELFSERAGASGSEFVLRDADTPAVCEICRRLDGLPLALELAAAQVAVFGVQGLARALNDRFAALTRGRRTVLERHQTLRATMDWSYDLLSDAERTVLRRLAVFRGDFAMRAAVAVASDVDSTSVDVVGGVGNLVDKSLIAADTGSDVAQFRLLDTTRAYALQVLQDSGEYQQVMLRHANYYRELFAHAALGAAARTKAEWAAAYGRETDNLRVALDWALSPGGDGALGVSLAAAASDFWIAMSLLNECCDWGLRALAQLGEAKGTRDEMLLQCSLGQALTFSRGMQNDARVALTRAVALATELGDPQCQFRATYVLWQYRLRHVDFRDCLALASQCTTLAETMNDAAATSIADFAFGQARYYLGEHAAAAANLERTRSIYPVAMRGGDRIRFSADVPACAMSYQAVTYWSLGFLDEAARAAREAVIEARSVNDPVALCISLCGPNSIAMLKMGYLAEVQRSIDELITHAETHSLTPYYAFGLCAKGDLIAALGDPGAAARWLRLGIQRSRDVAYYLFDAYFRGELAAVLMAAGSIDEGLSEIDGALRYAEESESLWCMPEILRIKGDLVARCAGAIADTAEEWFMRSRELANRQGALSWELRSAMSLARFWQERDRAADAHALLDETYRRFTDGFETADLRAADRLLQQSARRL